MYFPAGSRCTWVGGWQTVGWFSSPVTALSDVTSYLEANCNMAIESSSVTEPSILSTSSTRTVTLKVRSLIDRNDINDIDSDIRGAFYKSISQYPDSSSIVNYALVQADGTTAAPKSTGASDTATDNPNDTSNPNDNNSQSLSDWWNNLIGQAEAGTVGLIVGAVAVVGVLIYFSVSERVPA